MSVAKHLTQFGDALSDKDSTKINSEWETLQLGNNFVGISLEDSQYLLENVQRIENNVVFVFDFAITAMSLYRDFLFFLPNFMNAVVNYLAGILYNALDSFLRLGMYALVVPPNLADTSFQGLPTTSLKEQADNAYKKFYDVSDPNLPYNLPFEKNLAEQIIDNGDKLKNKLKFYFENKDSPFYMEGANKKLAHFDRNYTDFEKAARNLEIPVGFYDAIYLYFAISYNSGGGSTVDNWIEAVAKIGDLFKFPTVEGLLKEYDSLFRPKRKRIKVLCVDKITELTKVSVTKSQSSENLKRIDMDTQRRNYSDPDLKPFRMMEADPLRSMSNDRKERLISAFEKQLDRDKKYKEQLGDQGLDAMIEYRLKHNREYRTLQEDIAEIEDEIKYYDYKEYVKVALNGTSKHDFDTFYTKLKSDEKHFNQLNNVSEYPNAAAFQSEREVFYTAYAVYQNTHTATALVKANALQNLTKSQERLFKIGENIVNETIVTLTPPDMSQAERSNRLNEKLYEEDKIKTEITHNTKEYLESELTDRINRIIKSKKDQIKYLEESRWIGGDGLPIIKDYEMRFEGAQITFLTNFYANSGRSSLYESYMDKFYNFNTIADTDYMYEFIIEVDSSREGFSTKIDKFHPGQYVVIGKENGAGYFDYVGSGIIVAEVAEHFTDAGVGTWVSANFSDIVGLTADIKRLQNEILGFKNLFKPNTSAFDAIIDFLKNVKQRILDLIRILKELISIIQLLLSIQLAGKVQGKYVRERDYDQMAAVLCDTSKLPKQTTKRNWKPSQNATVRHYLARIRAVDPQRAADIADRIDTLYTKTAPEDDEYRKDTIDANRFVSDAYPASAEMHKRADQLKESILLELQKKVDNVQNMFDLGRSTGARLTSSSKNENKVESKEDGEKRDKDYQLETWERKIWNELHAKEAALTNEFGFSLILLSYLPQGLPFYPVRWMAERLGLVEQDLGIVGNTLKANIHGRPNPFILDGLDEGTIQNLMPKKSPSDLVGIMTQNSIARNPAVGYTPKPIAFKVKFNPLVSTAEFNFTLKPILDGTIQGEIGYSNTDNTFKVDKSLRTRYLAGAYLTKTNGEPITLTTDKALNTNYKYLYEIVLGTGIGSAGGCGENKDLDKLQVHLGGFPFASATSTGDAFLHTHRKGYERNSDGNTMFRFGRMAQKIFSAEIYVKQDTTAFLPYILIGHDDDKKLNEFIFELIDSTIKFYRIA